MIKAQELRLGNYVLVDSQVVSITNLGCDEVWHTATEFEGIVSGEPKAIPTTKEWLLKLGFKLKDKIGFYYELEDMSVMLPNPLDKFNKKGRIYWNSWTIKDQAPKSVHELQNLYFALTGKELKKITK